MSLSDEGKTPPGLLPIKMKAPKMKKIINFSENFMDNIVHFQIMLLNNALYIWVGDEKASMNQLSMALMSRLVQYKHIYPPSSTHHTISL